MKNVLRWRFAVLALAFWHTQVIAESPVDALWRQHAKLQSLAGQVVRDQTKLTESPSQILANRPAIDQLMACSESLLSAAREFSVLIQSIHLALLVTEEKNMASAALLVDGQISLMLEKLGTAATAIDQRLPFSPTPEVTERLNLTRLQLREASELLVVLRTPEAERKK